MSSNKGENGENCLKKNKRLRPLFETSEYQPDVNEEFLVKTGYYNYGSRLEILNKYLIHSQYIVLCAYIVLNLKHCEILYRS